MAITDTTTAPSGGNHPLAFTPEAARLGVDVLVEPDHDHGLVVLILAAEPRLRISVAEDGALDLALRLIGGVSRLRRSPEAGA